MSGLTEANRLVIEDFARIFYAERNVPEAFAAHVAEVYIQHNPTLGDGRDAAVEMLTDKFATPGAIFDVQRILVDEDLAVIHIKASFPGRPVAAVADFYRLEGGKVVEHWDVLQPMPENPVSLHPMF